jgi:hypothetical protein
LYLIAFHPEPLKSVVIPNAARDPRLYLIAFHPEPLKSVVIPNAARDPRLFLFLAGPLLHHRQGTSLASGIMSMPIRKANAAPTSRRVKLPAA